MGAFMVIVKKQFLGKNLYHFYGKLKKLSKY